MRSASRLLGGGLRGQRHVVLVAGHRRVVVQALGHQLQRQRIFLTRGFFDLRALVLEPDLDLGLVEAQFGAELLPSALGQVAIFVELVLEARQLGAGEGRPRPLVLAAGLGGLLHATGAGACNHKNCSRNFGIEGTINLPAGMPGRRALAVTVLCSGFDQ